MSDPLINKKLLHQLYRQDFTLDGAAEDLVGRVGEDFFQRVLQMSCEVASARNARTLEIEDIRLVLERYWEINLPELEPEEWYKPEKSTVVRIRKDGGTRRYRSRKVRGDRDLYRP